MLPLSELAAPVSVGVADAVAVGIVMSPVMVGTPEVNGTLLARVAPGKAADWVASSVSGVSPVLLGFKTLLFPA